MPDSVHHVGSQFAGVEEVVQRVTNRPVVRQGIGCRCTVHDTERDPPTGRGERRDAANECGGPLNRRPVQVEHDRPSVVGESGPDHSPSYGAGRSRPRAPAFRDAPATDRR